MSTILALPTVAETLPIMLLASALIADDTLPFPQRLEVLLASIFVWKVASEFNEVHRASMIYMQKYKK